MAGSYREKAAYQTRSVGSTDTYGEETYAYADAATVWVQRRSLTLAERSGIGVEYALETAVYDVRPPVPDAMSSVPVGGRLVIGTTTWEIVGSDRPTPWELSLIVREV